MVKWEEDLSKRSKYLRDNIFHVEELENLDKEEERKQQKFYEKITDVEEKVRAEQKFQVEQLFNCYNYDADHIIEQAGKEQKEEDGYEDFELVEIDELNGEEYKEYEKKAKQNKDPNLGKSQYGILDGAIMFKSNYFGDRSMSADNTEPKGLQQPAKLENALSDKVEEKEEKKLKSGMSDEDSLSSDYDDEEDEMVGTFYFLDHRRTRTKNIHHEHSATSLRHRRHSAEDNRLDLGSTLLQTSVATPMADNKIFSERKWREIHSLITHKALLTRTLASILQI